MNAKIKILIVEHNPDDIELLEKELKKGGLNFISKTAQNEQNYINTLKDFLPDLILSDYSFPSFDGTRAFKIKEEIAPLTPFVMVSGTIGEEKAVELIRSGVTDYVMKDKLFTLNTKVNRALKEATKKRELMLTEQQIEFDRYNLNALINNTEDLMWSVDRHFKLITSNKPFDEMAKINFGKIIAQGDNILLTSYTPEMLNRFQLLYERAFSGEAFTKTEYFDTPIEFWTEISYSPIRKGNEVIGAACHSRDITGRKRTEQHLQKSEAFNRGVFDSLSSHIAVLDSTGTIVAVNEAWNHFALENGETSLQRTGEGSNYFTVCKKSAKAGDSIAVEALKGMNDVMNEKTGFFYLEYPCHSPDEQRWFTMRVMKFKSDTPMIIVAHESITDLKKAEKERDHTKEANEKLKKIRHDLDNALAKEKELNGLQSRFVSMASHEFRTPLTIMMSSLSLITKYGEINDKIKQLKHINNVKLSIMNLIDILNDFLSVSKLEEGKTKNVPEKVNVKLFIADIIVDIRSMATDGQNFIQKHSGNEIVSIDKRLLKNVLFNLISNAIKFSSNNGSIEITTQVHNSCVKFLVKDSGIGISKEDQKHLFERFFRGNNATHIQGTGLGLNIVARYVDLMNGKIEVESKENKGATFIIVIPQ